MSNTRSILGLDVGTVRIGVAIADRAVGIAIPHDTITVDGTEIQTLAEIVLANDIDTVVVGYPRNQSGEPTKQTAQVEAFVEKLRDFDVSIQFQDESLTSVIAEQRLQQRGQPYEKSDIDKEAAAILLQDYLEQTR